MKLQIVQNHVSNVSRETSFLNTLISTIQMDATSFPETSLPIYTATRQHIQAEIRFDLEFREFKSIFTGADFVKKITDITRA